MSQAFSSSRRTILLDAFLVFALTAALIWPLFKIKYQNHWDSIESTFIADARFLKDHWPHPRWQPLWYCGTRFDYIYPPALRYGTAALAKIAPILPVRAYHIYIAFFYCFGISAVYVFVRVVTGSRGAAWLAAAAAALLSPSFLFLPDNRRDAWLLSTHRLNALVRYGEGPHMTALAWLPLALAASFRALEKPRLTALALAALFSAIVVSHNFYGATALAIFFPILTWSIWITGRDNRVWMRAAAIPALAYGLTAFWLTPSYLRLTSFNLNFVTDAGNRWSLWVTAALAALLAFASYKWANRRPERAYLVFVSGASMAFALNVLGNHYLRFRVAGDPMRLAPELDLALILLSIEALRRLWQAGGIRRVSAAILVVASFSVSVHYLRRPRSIFLRDPVFENRIEYRLTGWIAENLPGLRAMATGSVRFWYDAWHDLPQLGGGSEQGLLNPAVMPAQWEIVLAASPEASISWMSALGVDIVIVHTKASQEFHHDFQFPEKFAGVLPVLYDNHQGDIIYRVPRRYSSLGRVVRKAQMESLPPIRFAGDTEGLRAYADAVEKGPDSPVTAAWEGTDAMRVAASVKHGESILVQVSYDPAWRAYSAGKPLPIRKDILGQILIDAPPGDHDIRLVFELPLENYIGRILSGISGIVLIGLLVAGARRKERLA